MRETEVDVGGRGNGKTYRMILAAEADDAIIVAPNEKRADSIRRQAKAMDADIRVPMSFDQACRLPFHEDRSVMIDEAQTIFGYLINQPIHRISIYGVDVSPKERHRANPVRRLFEKLRKVWER